MKYSLQSSKGNSLPVVIGIVLFVLVIGGIAALFFTGYLKVGPNVASSNQGGLCESLISDYNSAFTETSVDNYASKLASAAKGAAAISDNQSDPNCVFMQFTNAAYTKNVNDTRTFADTLKSLANDGKYVTGQLANPLGIKAIEQNAAVVTSPDNINSNSSIKGNG
jgi:hypothetical protein